MSSWEPRVYYMSRNVFRVLEKLVETGTMEVVDIFIGRQVRDAAKHAHDAARETGRFITGASFSAALDEVVDISNMEVADVVVARQAQGIVTGSQGFSTEAAFLAVVSMMDATFRGGGRAQATIRPRHLRERASMSEASESYETRGTYLEQS